MPQASEELRAKMKRRFGSATDEAGPIQFLLGAGYTLRRGWSWSKPGVVNVCDMTKDEYDCLIFLVHEWDFGGLESA